MLTRHGEYRNGKIHIANDDLPNRDMKVIVTFLDGGKERQGKLSGAAFVAKWGGFLKDVPVDDWKAERIAELERKHS